ncbi:MULTISPECIES: hypothetical protein [unclassified Pseudomonas]|uniref:hypothetical protein n=1 Tax=unclassified Pseudomonas TaxID=196821 RepID=UPI000AA9E8DA|nr:MULTISPECIES: hypothetical protein [unclassified Pseudomonas]QOF82284.1 hypothetical protein IG194_16930 [Pseudomonas sp. ADPe]
MDRFVLQSIMCIAEKAYLADSVQQNLLYVFKLDGFIEALFVSSQISAEQSGLLRSFSINLQFEFDKSHSCFPSAMNVGPIMPSWVARQRRALA